MAHQVNSEVTGTIENLVFYERYGKFLIRTVQKQAVASQESAKAFSTAASAAKTLRNLSAPLILNPRDKGMQNRLTTAMLKFLALDPAIEFDAQSNPLAGFRFMEDSDLQSCLNFTPLISEEQGTGIRVELPAFNARQSVIAPAETSRMELRFLAAVLHPGENSAIAGTPELVHIPYTAEMRPPLEFILNTGPRAGLTAVAAALSYWEGDRQISQPGFMPVGIVAAFK